MSLSPTGSAPAVPERRAEYELGWVAIHKMLRDGLSWSGREKEVSLLNTGGARFTDVSAVSGLGVLDDLRGAAHVDWDQDGDLDLWASGRSSPRVRFWRNRGTGDPEDSFALRLEGRACNRDAIGARVEVNRRGAPMLQRSLRAGEGYLAQSSKWLHFGLGRARDIERVVVHWPGGESEAFEGVRPGGRFVLVQGSKAAESWKGAARAVRLAAAATAPLAPSARARIVLASRVPVPEIAGKLRSGEAVSLRPSSGSPRLVLLWASWCAPCLAELKALASAQGEIEAAGLEVIALSADEADKLEASHAALEQLAWPFPSAWAERATLDLLDVLQRAIVDRRRPLALPASFLLDAEGNLAAVYRGPVEVQVLLGDVSRLRAAPEEIRRSAAPFPGRWVSPPPRADLARFETLLDQAGCAEAARFYRLLQYRTRQSSPAEVLYQMGLVRARQGMVAEAADLFGQASAQEPGRADLCEALGTALHEIGRLDEAIEAYESALRIETARADSLHNLALALQAAGREAEAREKLERLRLVDAALGDDLARRLDSAKNPGSGGEPPGGR